MPRVTLLEDQRAGRLPPHLPKYPEILSKGLRILARSAVQDHMRRQGVEPVNPTGEDGTKEHAD